MTDAQQTRIFFGLLLAYFTIQTLLRTALGGTFEFDEAEMFVLSQDYRLGYGPQPPLYNWFQTFIFDLFGPTTFSIAVAKNILLFATYALTFDGLRRLVAPRVAIAATLALLLLPNVSWEGQRAGSHSIAMLAMIGLTLNVLSRRIALSRQNKHAISHAIALGCALGLGGLTKFNFWLFPLPLLLIAGIFPEIRKALWRKDLLATALVALVILSAPMGWVLTHMDHATSTSRTLYHAPAVEGLPRPLLGVITMLVETFAALALLLLILLIFRLPYARRVIALGSAPTLSRWLIGAGLLTLILITPAVIGFGVTDVQARWLIPVLIPMAIGLMIWIFPTLTPRLQRIFFWVCTGLAMLIIVALADTRLRGAGSDSLDIETLAAILETELPESAAPITVISYNFYYPGNLKYLRPDWVALPSEPGGTVPEGLERIVVIAINDPQSVRARLANHGLIPRDATIGKLETATLPYRFEDKKTRSVPYMIVDLKPSP